jgi:hypothetical protein
MKRNMLAWKDEVIASPVKKAIPILSFPSVQLMGISVKELIADSKTQAKAMKLLTERNDSLAAVSMMDLSVEAEAFGAEIQTSDDEVPVVVGALVKTQEDADNLRVPKVGEARTQIYIDAMKEAVMNAILHADYFAPGGLTIRRTDDTLQVENPGLLRVNPNQVRDGGSADPRNRTLTNLFSLVKLATGQGLGLKGIYKTWARQGWKAPTLSEAFQAGITSLSLPLPRRTFSQEEMTRQLIAEYLTDQVVDDASGIAKALGLTVTEVTAALDQMLEKAFIVESPEGYRLRA